METNQSQAISKNSDNDSNDDNKKVSLGADKKA